jgi:hypothetical protein
MDRRTFFPLLKALRFPMATGTSSPITPITISHLPPAACPLEQGIPRVYGLIEGSFPPRRWARRPAARILIRPQPGFYVMRLRSGAPLVAAIIYQLCPMVIPQPLIVAGPHPDDWCRPLDRSPRFEARVDYKRVDLDRVWTARSLRPVSHAEFLFRNGPLRRWARQNPSAPEARPHRPVDLAAIPPLF